MEKTHKTLKRIKKVWFYCLQAEVSKYAADVDSLQEILYYVESKGVLGKLHTILATSSLEQLVEEVFGDELKRDFIMELQCSLLYHLSEEEMSTLVESFYRSLRAPVNVQHSLMPERISMSLQATNNQEIIKSLLHNNPWLICVFLLVLYGREFHTSVLSSMVTE